MPTPRKISKACHLQILGPTCLSMALTFRSWPRMRLSLTAAYSSSIRRPRFGKSGMPEYSFSFAVLQKRQGRLGCSAAMLQRLPGILAIANPEKYHGLPLSRPSSACITVVKLLKNYRLRKQSCCFSSTGLQGWQCRRLEFEPWGLLAGRDHFQEPSIELRCWD